jgi:hypothetical protein
MENLIAQAQPPNCEAMATKPEMWGRDIEACRRMLASLLALRARYTDELPRFRRTNLLLEMLNQIVDAAQVTVEDAEERLTERLQANGRVREGPPRSFGEFDPSRFSKASGEEGPGCG